MKMPPLKNKNKNYFEGQKLTNQTSHVPCWTVSSPICKKESLGEIIETEEKAQSRSAFHCHEEHQIRA